MIRHNLSTRPFYNQRAVHVVLALVSLAAIAATALNVWQFSTLSGRQARLQADLQKVQREVDQVRARAAALRATVNPRDLDSAIVAAEEANLAIERRVFSWTELLNRFETTLPDSVRIASVRPLIDRGTGMVVSVVVVARNAEGINAFVEQLERTGTFAGLLSREEFVRDDGTLQASLEGQYTPGLPRAARVQAVRR